MASLKQPGQGGQDPSQAPDPYNLDPNKPKQVPNMMGQQPPANTHPQGTPSVTQPGPPQLVPPMQRMAPPPPQALTQPQQSGSMYGNGQGSQPGGNPDDMMAMLASLMGQ